MNELAVKKKTEVAQVEITPMQMIKAAMEKGVDSETLGKMMDLQERYEASQAKKAYVAAMNEFCSNRPKILKNKEVSFKSTRYKHASLDSIIAAITPALSECGLSFNWVTAQENGQIIVTCKVTHIDGHSEQTTLNSAADNSGGKNSIQAIGSSTHYLQRYTLCSILGLAASEDDDGQASEVEFITKEQAADLQALIESKSFSKQRHAAILARLAKDYGATSFEKVKAGDLDIIVRGIEAMQS